MEVDHTRMAHEDQTQKGNNSVSSRSSKKPKQKKVPQRGLGVAQLEKIRLEEQQKKDATSAILPSPCSVSSTKSSSISPQIPKFHHLNQPTSSIPIPSVSPSDFRSPLSLPHKDTVPLVKSDSFDAVSVTGHGNVPKLNFEKDQKLALLSNLPQEFNPILSLSDWMPRTPHYHQPSSLMVNVPSGTTDSSAPVPRFSLEPPSNQNQNYSGNSVLIKPIEKVVGIKRSYPFSLDIPPAPTFNYNRNFPTFSAMRTNATPCCQSG